MTRLRADQAAGSRPRTGDAGRRGRATSTGADPAQATEPLPVVEPSGSVVPLGTAGSIVVATVALVVSLIAVGATSTLAGSASFRAQAQVAIVPAPGGGARLATLVAAGEPAKVASAVLVDRVVATRAAAGIGGSPAISAAATAETITITVTANSAAAAERVAQAVVDLGAPAAAPVIAPLRLVQIGRPAGTAVAAGLPAGAAIAAVAPVAFLLGLLIALVTRHLVLRLARPQPGHDDPHRPGTLGTTL